MFQERTQQAALNRRPSSLLQGFPCELLLGSYLVTMSSIYLREMAKTHINL